MTACWRIELPYAIYCRAEFQQSERRIRSDRRVREHSCDQVVQLECCLREGRRGAKPTSLSRRCRKHWGYSASGKRGARIGLALPRKIPEASIISFEPLAKAKKRKLENTCGEPKLKIRFPNVQRQRILVLRCRDMTSLGMRGICRVGNGQRALGERVRPAAAATLNQSVGILNIVREPENYSQLHDILAR